MASFMKWFLTGLVQHGKNIQCKKGSWKLNPKAILQKSHCFGFEEKRKKILTVQVMLTQLLSEVDY